LELGVGEINGCKIEDEDENEDEDEPEWKKV
jgi:hypothetical protein